MKSPWISQARLCAAHLGSQVLCDSWAWICDPSMQHGPGREEVSVKECLAVWMWALGCQAQEISSGRQFTCQEIWKSPSYAVAAHTVLSCFPGAQIDRVFCL